MFHIEVELTINRPIDLVFERLIDIDGYSDWLPKSRVFLDCRKTSEGPTSVGTTFIDRTRFGQFRGEVIAFERPTKVVFRNRLYWLGLPVMKSEPGYQLEPMEQGTRVHHFGQGNIFGLFKFMEAYVARQAKIERRRTASELKSSLEDPERGDRR